MIDPTYPFFPIMSFLGFVLALLPLPWHMQAWNAGTCAFMIWTSLSCLIEFINSIAWADNLRDSAPVWCDISTKFLIGSGVGITASTLCISRRLYSIATVQNASSFTYADKRRNLIIDLCIAVGIPIVVMALHYVVQPHRYDLLENVGCYAAIYNTLPTYFLLLMWPVVLGLVSFVYSALTFRAFWNRRLQFAQLISSNSSLSVSRYIRLMMLAVTDMMLTVPLASFSIFVGNYGVKLAPWISWEDTHFNFSRVGLVPALIWRSDPWYTASVELTRWIYVASALIFFALFGFASEAQRHYKIAFMAIARAVGLGSCVERKFGKQRAKSEASTLPSWNKGSLDLKTLPSLPRSPLPSGKDAEFPISPMSSLPAYSPAASSFYPMKPSGAISHKNISSKTPHYDLERASDSDSDLGLNSPTLDTFDLYDEPSYSHTQPEPTSEQKARFSWKDISLPSTGRRFSSSF